MSVQPRKRKNGVVYYVVTRWEGAHHWERVGPDKREAKRLDDRYKKQVAAGTFSPKVTGASTVLSYGRTFVLKRKNRSARNDRSYWANHVERLGWLMKMRLEDVEIRHVHRAVEELKAPYGDGETLSPKAHGLACDVLRGMFTDAHLQGVIAANPYVLRRGMVSRRVKNPRTPYPAGVAVVLMRDERIALDQLVTNALLLYTAGRIGEVCGLRWRDWDQAPKPLGSLLIDSQYQDEPLKTDDADKARPRLVPVHPELARALETWRSEGWEWVYGRKPAPEDFLLPRIGELHRARSYSMAYKAWRRGCKAAEIANQTVHATRHTAITQARRGGARKDVFERITHNAKGDIVDAYTHWDWAPLCEAMLCLGYGTAAPAVDASVDAAQKHRENLLRLQDSNPSPESHGGNGSADPGGSAPSDDPPKTRRIHDPHAARSARQLSGGSFIGPKTHPSLLLERARREALQGRS